MSLFPKVLWPFNYLTLAQNKPWVLWMLSIIWSFLPDNDWWALHICPVFLCKLNPVKAHWGTDSWPFSFERSATFLPQADHVLVDLFSSVVARGGGDLAGGAPPTIFNFKILNNRPQLPDFDSYLYNSLLLGFEQIGISQIKFLIWSWFLRAYSKKIQNSAMFGWDEILET